MVRLTTRSFLHLSPEMVGTGFQHPFYAKVVRVSKDEVTFKSLEGGEGSVPHDTAKEHVVSAREVTLAGPVSYLRRAVCAKLDGDVYYGQVVAVEDDKFTITTGETDFVTAVGDVSPVPPIVVLLLEHVKFSIHVWSESDLEDLQITLMDRILGRNGFGGPNSIAEVLEGLIRDEDHPPADKTCRWTDPVTGASALFPLQHALDFAYFVDGGHEPVPDHIGVTFYCPPPQHGESEQDNVDQVSELGIFDPFDDDDTTPMDESEVCEGVRPVGGTAQRNPKRARPIETSSNEVYEKEGRQQRRRSFRSAVDTDAMIVDKLSDDPELLERFLQIRRSDSNRTGVVAAQSSPNLPLTTMVYSPEPTKTNQTSSKYAFVPRPDQQYVHDRITADKHKGKTPTMYVSALVRSKNVKFKALPGVCTRVFDIRFGSKGLSVRHFARFSEQERVKWLEAGGSNFDNLSSSAEFAKAPPATSFKDVVECVRVFQTYTREYCCEELVELTGEILVFLEETLIQIPWSQQELSTLVYWINDVLEDFHVAAETDNDLRQVKLRCSTEDRLLRDLMFVKIHRQVDELSQPRTVTASPSTESKVAVGRHQRSGNREANKNLGRIPAKVLQRLPAQVDPGLGAQRPLFMRFLSNNGCLEDANGCPSGRGHFVPKNLADVVKAEVNKRFGGLKAECNRL